MLRRNARSRGRCFVIMVIGSTVDQVRVGLTSSETNQVGRWGSRLCTTYVGGVALFAGRWWFMKVSHIPWQTADLLVPRFKWQPLPLVAHASSRPKITQVAPTLWGPTLPGLVEAKSRLREEVSATHRTGWCRRLYEVVRWLNSSLCGRGGARVCLTEDQSSLGCGKLSTHPCTLIGCDGTQSTSNALWDLRWLSPIPIRVSLEYFATFGLSQGRFCWKLQRRCHLQGLLLPTVRYCRWRGQVEPAVQWARALHPSKWQPKIRNASLLSVLLRLLAC